MTEKSSAAGRPAPGTSIAEDASQPPAAVLDTQSQGGGQRVGSRSTTRSRARRDDRPASAETGEALANERSASASDPASDGSASVADGASLKVEGSDEASAEYDGPERRKSVVDRRLIPGGFERRRGPGKRRTTFARSAEEGHLSREQFLFVMAIDAYKRANQRPYPTWTEVLEVIRKLGYRKTQPMSVELGACEDWYESPEAPAFAEEPGDDDRTPPPSAA
jgi:hypothetical protein